MAVSGVGNNFNYMYGNTYAVQNHEKTEEDKIKNRIDKKEEMKETTYAQAGKAHAAGEKKVSDDYAGLQKNYDGMSGGNVSISGGYLKKCMEDSQKAKELEDFLKKIPELEKQGYEQLSVRNRAMGGTVTCYQQTWMIHEDGSIQSTVYSVTETGMTNAERMKKQMDERLEKQKEKKEEDKKAEDKKAENKKAEAQKAQEQKKETAQQAEKPDGSAGNISMTEAAGHEITVKYVEAETGPQVLELMRKEKLEKARYQNIDVLI